jgi:hypothetical protein
MKITFFISERHNPNYLAEIVEITNVRKHPNADALDLVTIYGNDIVVAKDSIKIGDIMVYCPVESALSASFLKCNNQFRDAEMNSNKEIKGGFFEHHGRVKAVRLREIPSTGFLFPPEWLQKWGKEMQEDFSESACGRIIKEFLLIHFVVLN